MNLSDIPTGTRTLLDDLRNQWEALSGFTTPVTDAMLVAIYQERTPTSLSEFGQRVTPLVAPTLGWNIYDFPWMQFGISQDQYHSQATTYATEYKKITGQDIPADQLHQAFMSTKDATGGLLTGSEYVQQLTNDLNIQKTFGWVKFGMDFNQFQQQKLQMRESFGRELSDAEAVVQLQYDHANQGSNQAVRAATPSQAPKSAVGVGQSIAR